MMPYSDYLSKFHPHDVDVARRCREASAAAIRAGDRKAAIEAVDQAFAELEATDRPSVDSPICEILSAQPKIVEILHSGGIYTIGQLIDETRETLFQRYVIRYRSINIIESELFKHHFSLRRSET